MKPNPLKDKSFQFALETFNICKLLDEKHEYVVSKQLKKSGTSIGAQVFESENAESKADFIHKLSIAQKEANETLYWVHLIVHLNIVDNFILENYLVKANEIKARITSILIKLKNS